MGNYACPTASSTLRPSGLYKKETLNMSPFALNLLKGLGPPWAGGVPPFALNPVNVISWGLPGPDLSLGPGKSPRGRVPERPCFLVVLCLKNCLFCSSGDQWCFWGFQKSMALVMKVPQRPLYLQICNLLLRWPHPHTYASRRLPGENWPRVQCGSQVAHHDLYNIVRSSTNL